MAIKHKWLLVAGIILIASVGVLWWRWVYTPGLEIVRSSTGGFGGHGDGKNVTLKNGDLSASERQELRKKINDIHFFTFASRYSAPHCADMFVITLNVRAGAQNHTVTYDDCDQKDLPAGLVDLDKYVKQLAGY